MKYRIKEERRADTSFIYVQRKICFWGDWEDMEDWNGTSLRFDTIGLAKKYIEDVNKSNKLSEEAHKNDKTIFHYP